MAGHSEAKAHYKNHERPPAAAQAFRPSVMVFACVFVSLWAAIDCLAARRNASIYNKLKRSGLIC